MVRYHSSFNTLLKCKILFLLTKYHPVLNSEDGNITENERLTSCYTKKVHFTILLNWRKQISHWKRAILSDFAETYYYWWKVIYEHMLFQLCCASKNVTLTIMHAVYCDWSESVCLPASVRVSGHVLRVALCQTVLALSQITFHQW